MTLNEKLKLIDAYLAEEPVDPAWSEMLHEYRKLLVEKGEPRRSEYAERGGWVD